LFFSRSQEQTQVPSKRRAAALMINTIDALAFLRSQLPTPLAPSPAAESMLFLSSPKPREYLATRKIETLILARAIIHPHAPRRASRKIIVADG
jgi:hypothetical protein